MANDSAKRWGISEAAAARPVAQRRRGRARWCAVGLAGLTGVAGFAAFSGAAGAVAAHGLNSGLGGLGALSSAAMGLIPGGAGAAPSGGQLNGSGQYQEELVPCDADKLIAAIVRGNATGGARLRLTGQCRYTLTAAAQGLNGLPIITQPITVNGQGATIVRAANAANFRIVDVGPGGNLTLDNLTITGGFAPDSAGGGGVLVQSGGRATLRDATVTGNQSTFVGGGIANYGVTTVSGHDDGKGSRAASGAPASGQGNVPANGSTQASPSGRGGGVVTGTGTAQELSRVSYNAAQTAGGGIYNGGRLTVSDAEVSYNNSTRSGGGLTDLGGAALEKTRIDHNNATAADGGGIASFDTVTTLEDSSVTDNSADARGGGITSVGSAFYLRGTGVDRNTAGLTGGGIYNQSDLNARAHMVIEQSEVNGNTTASNGGGIGNISGGDLVVRRSQISLNKAVGAASQGGGIVNDSASTASLTATQVTKNSSTVAPGGIFSGGAITVDQRSVIVTNRPTNCTGSPNTVPNCFG